MRKANQIAGWNDRFADSRFQGFSGDGGANQFPYETAVELVATDPAGTFDSVVVPPASSISCTTTVVVTEVFDGVPTLIVGNTGDTNALVELAEVDLTELGTTVVTRNVTWAAALAVRATVGGAPTQGSASISVQFQF